MKAMEAVAIGFRHTHQAWPIIGMGFGLGAGMSVLQELTETNSNAGLAGALLSALLLFGLILLIGVFWALWFGGLLGWTRDRFSGVPTSWTRFQEAGSQLFWRICRLLTIEAALIIGVILAGGLGSFVLFRFSPALVVVPMILTFLATSLLMLLVTYSGASLVQHGGGAMASIKDSIRFARSRFWGTAWLVSLISVVCLGLYAVMFMGVAGILFFKAGSQELLRILKEQPLPLTLATDAVGAYVWVFCNIALYAYYVGNQPEPKPFPVAS